MNKMYETIETILKIVKHSKLICNFEKANNTNILKILANGPSLKHYNPESESFLNEDYLVVNDFASTDLYIKIKPQLYVLADGTYGEKYENLKENLRDRHIKTFSALLKTDWEIELYVPFSILKSITERLSSNPYIKIRGINMLEIKGLAKFKFLCYKYSLGMPLAQNVLIPSIFIGLQKRYKYLYIYGADHSWIENIRVDVLNRVCLYDKHFYDKGTPEMTPWYKPNGEIFKMHEILDILSKTFYSYSELNDYSTKLNIQIFNMTGNSFIDAFKKQIL